MTTRHPHDPPSDLLHLHAGDLHLLLTPDVGGSIASFSRRWTEGGQPRETHWLRPATAQGLRDRNPLAMASFPLVPFCNRIRDGVAQFEGHAIRFPPNHPAEDTPHPLHGIGWQRPWSVRSATQQDATLELEVDAGPAWPWAFSARQVYRLDGDGLHAEIAVTNRGDSTMPAGIGHHPYFPHPPGTRLRTATRAIWEADDQVLPTGLAESALVRQLREGVDLAQVHCDNNFTGWGREAVVEWPADADGPARRAVLRAEAPLDFFVLYCQRGYEFFCAEPVSQCTDWLNLQGQWPQADLGGARLAPGQTLVGRWSLAPG